MKNQWPVDFVIVIIAVTSINFWLECEQWVCKQNHRHHRHRCRRRFFLLSHQWLLRARSIFPCEKWKQQQQRHTDNTHRHRSLSPSTACQMKWKNQQLNNRARALNRPPSTRSPAHTHTCTHGVPVYASNVCDKFHSSNTLQNQSNSMLLLFSLFSLLSLSLSSSFCSQCGYDFAWKKFVIFLPIVRIILTTRIASEYFFYRTKKHRDSWMKREKKQNTFRID